MEYLFYYNLTRNRINTQNKELQIILKLLNKDTLKLKSQIKKNNLFTSVLILIAA